MLDLIDAKVAILHKDAADGLRWGELHVQFLDKETKHIVGCTIHSAIPIDREASFREVEEAIRHNAASILSATLEAIRQPIADLAVEEGVRRAAADAAILSLSFPSDTEEA